MRQRDPFGRLLSILGELAFVTVFSVTIVYLVVAIHSFFTSIFKGTL